MVSLQAGALRCEIQPALGGCVAGLWLGDVPVLRSTPADQLVSARLAGSYPLVPFSNRIGQAKLEGWVSFQHDGGGVDVVACEGFQLVGTDRDLAQKGPSDTRGYPRGQEVVEFGEDEGGQESRLTSLAQCGDRGGVVSIRCVQRCDQSARVEQDHRSPKPRRNSSARSATSPD